MQIRPLALHIEPYGDSLRTICIFTNSAVKVQHVLFANEPFLRKMVVSFFSSNIPLTLKKILWKKYVRFWIRNLKRTPHSAQNLFSRKSDLKFCIIFNLILFVNAQGSVKIRPACSKALLLTISSSNTITNSNGYIKGGIYFFFL